MTRVIGFILAMLGIGMALFGFVRPGSNMCFIALIPIIVGALLFAMAQRGDKEALEQRRHEDMMEAIRQQKKQ